MNNLKKMISLLLIASTILCISQACLELVHQWKDLEYKFPSTALEQQAIQTKKYIRRNGVPIDVAPYYGPQSLMVFVTIPRFTVGIPFSLAVVSSESGPNGPYLLPYPNYDWHSSHGADCNGITSVFRVAIDKCKRLWVLDTGKIGDTQYCPPQLLIFDLNSHTLIRQHKFSKPVYNAQSLVITPIVDVRDNCVNTKVYIADVQGYAIIVYDYMLDKSWRTEHPLMQPLQQYANFTIAGESFTLMDGVFGLSVTPPGFTNYENRLLYFHALASYKENAVPLWVLDDYRYWTNNVHAMQDKFQTIGQRNTQAVAMAMDSYGHLFAGPISPIGISSWYIAQPYSTHYIVYKNSVTLHFISGMKITRNTYDQEELWVCSNRFQKTMAGTRNFNEINFRIQGQLTSTVLNGNCY